MANKYKDYDKYMLSFTIPSIVRGRTIKNGRYTKLRELIKIRAYIAKLLNNSDDVKYFMNIELGKKYSNPHIHLQLWVKPSKSFAKTKERKQNASKAIVSPHIKGLDNFCENKGKETECLKSYSGMSTTLMSQTYSTSSTSAEQILSKTISKFNLNKNRCYLTVPEKDIAVYDYVIKDYAKDLSDKDLWDLETQKKRMRKQLGKKVRFTSKSRDKFTKKIYRIMYYSYGIVRDMVEKSIDFFINNFFYFNKKRKVKIVSFCFEFSDLSYKEQERIFYFLDLIFEVLCSCRDPPFCFMFIYASKKFI